MSSNLPRPSLLLSAVVVLAVMAGTAGCVTMETTARTRASNDLRCSGDQVAVRNIGGSSYRATGCGQEVTYNCGQSSGNTFVCQREEQRSLTGAR
jgi:hypothetical protein